MANIDRALNIYQSYSLAKISALNKKSLAMHYAQCSEINKLEKSISRELQAVNKLNRQILENQLNEIKHKETIKFYRKIAFDSKEAIEIIDSQDNLMFKYFLLEIYAKPLMLLLEDAKSNLEEISDKEFCTVWNKRLVSLVNDALSLAIDFETTDYKVVLTTKENYDESIKKINDEIKETKKEQLSIPKFIPILPKTEKEYNQKGCLMMSILFVLLIIFGIMNSRGDDIITGIELLIISLIIFGLLLWRFLSRKKKYLTYVEMIQRQNYENEETRRKKLNNHEEQLNGLLKQLDKIKNSHPFSISRKNIKITNPNFDYILEEIDKYLPKEEKTHEKASEDPLYEEIKSYVISSRMASTSNIQRKFKLGYNRAVSIMDKLEVEGIIGPSIGGRARNVLIRI